MIPGANAQVEIDYQALDLAPGDLFLLATDGVYEHVSAGAITQALAQHAGDVDAAARAIVEQAVANDSPDNLTVQIVVVDELPRGGSAVLQPQAMQLPPPPLLEARALLDGWRIERAATSTSRWTSRRRRAPS